MQKNIFYLLALIVFSFSYANGAERPPLKLKPYETLGFPPMMNKEDFQYIVEQAANKIDYRKGYYKLGYNSDLMHGHVIFHHRDNETRYRDFREDDVSWEGLSPVAVVFHTQEYRHLWDDEFSGVDLKVMNRLDNDKRNWILWLRRTGLFRWRGRVQDAYPLRSDLVKDQEKRKEKRANTIYDADIDQRFFGKFLRIEGSKSFYFFRVECQQIPKRFYKDSNFIKIYHRKERRNMCLLLDNLHCQGMNAWRNYCPGVDPARAAQLPDEIETKDLIRQDF